MLYQEGVAPWVVASGGCRWHGVAEAEGYRRALVALGVPADRVMVELFSQSTGQNAIYVAELFRKQGWQSAALVTCDWHMPRATTLFARVGIECLAAPAPSPTASAWVHRYRRLRESLSLFLEREARP